jgi:hypothetical protein
LIGVARCVPAPQPLDLGDRAWGHDDAARQPREEETHPARRGFSIDTKRGLRGKNLAKVLDFAEAYWRQNYPDA